MTTALALTVTFRPITLWLLIAAGALTILGPVLAMITGRWLEIGALVPWAVCWILAAVALVLAAGSML